MRTCQRYFRLYFMYMIDAHFKTCLVKIFTIHSVPIADLLIVGLFRIKVLRHIAGLALLLSKIQVRHGHGSTRSGRDFRVQFALNLLLLGHMVLPVSVVMNCTLYRIILLLRLSAIMTCIQL
jgi:hypothetical protein